MDDCALAGRVAYLGRNAPRAVVFMLDELTARGVLAHRVGELHLARLRFVTADRRCERGVRARGESEMRAR
eukprot:6214794-Pleurochrysis_carterae.AAC.5